MNTSVVETLKAAGLYRESGRMAEQTLKTILPDGQITEHLMSEIDYYDLKTLGDELDIMLAHENPAIQALFAKNAVAIANAVRAVNVESASGFKGAVGGGRQLDVVMLRAEQFQDPDQVITTMRSTWLRATALITTTNFIQDDTTLLGNPLTMAATEALLIFAFANPSATPGVSAFQMTYIGRLYNIQNLTFELAHAFNGYPLVELKEPLIVYPRETILIQTREYVAVNDETWPIGLWVKMSTNLRNLALD